MKCEVNVSYSIKIESIRIAAGMSCEAMGRLLGLTAGEYGAMREGLREVTLRDVTSVADSPHTRHFSVWLISDRLIPDAGQISPDIARYGRQRTML